MPLLACALNHITRHSLILQQLSQALQLWACPHLIGDVSVQGSIELVFHSIATISLFSTVGMVCGADCSHFVVTATH